MARSKQSKTSVMSPLRGSCFGGGAAGQGLNDNRTVTELIRDISGLTFNDNGTPDKQAALIARPRTGKAGQAGRSASTTGKQNPGSRSSKVTSKEQTLKTRTFSQLNRPLKSVNEIFTAKENKAKFCMPLGLNSARDLEVIVKKEKELQEEQKRKKRHKAQLNSKQMHKMLIDCAKKRFPTDPRQHGKFTEIAQRIVKGDQIKMSIDYLQSNDFEIATNVLGGIDMVKDFFLFSDKCTARELQKCQDEFNKDLKKLRYKTRVNIWKYIKDPDAKQNTSGGEDGEDDDVVKEPSNTAYENIISQNPKINQQIAMGLAEQIASSQCLITFRLVNYRMSPQSWQTLGLGLGNAKNLRFFACNACNLYQDDNLKRLLSGLMNDVNKAARQKRKADDVLNRSLLSKSSSKTEADAPKEPFVYNHRPKVVKPTGKETAKQKMSKETRTFGASIETLDFSDNELTDMHGLYIVALIKSQSERRDHEMWLDSLRRSVAEDHLRMKKDNLNQYRQHIADVEASTAREINSNYKIKQMLANLDNHEHQTQDAILEHQAHIVNHKRLRTLFQSGLRQIILTRNKLGDTFAKSLQQALCYDKYIKSINVSGNKIGGLGMKMLLKLALLENSSILAFDARLNPGTSEKVERQLALCMLKNIEKMRQKDLDINPDFLKPELYSYNIPRHILKGLGLMAPGEKPRRGNSRASKRMNTSDNRSRQGNASQISTAVKNASMAQMMMDPAFEAYNTGAINLKTEDIRNSAGMYTQSPDKRVNVKRSQMDKDSQNSTVQSMQGVHTANTAKKARAHSSNQYSNQQQQMIGQTPTTATSKTRTRSSVKKKGGQMGHPQQDARMVANFAEMDYEPVGSERRLAALQSQNRAVFGGARGMNVEQISAQSLHREMQQSHNLQGSQQSMASNPRQAITQSAPAKRRR